MAIEFHCNNCGKLLSVPDGSGGREAKCPACATVCEIPLLPESPPPLQGGVPDDSPAGVPAPSANPYEAPHATEFPPRNESVEAGEISHQYVDVGEVLSRSWAIYKNQFGMLLALVLVGVALILVGQLAIQFTTQILGVIAAGIGGPVLMVPLALVLFVAQILFQQWISIGLIMALLEVARGKDVQIGTLFNGGPYLVRMFLAYLLVVLIMMVIVLVVCFLPMIVLAVIAGGLKVAGSLSMVVFVLAMIPVIYVSLGIATYPLFIVDQNAGVIDSLKLSWEFTYGNKFSLLLLWIVGIGLSIAGYLACCVGIIFVMPLIAMYVPVFYLAMTGQPITDRGAQAHN